MAIPTTVRRPSGAADPRGGYVLEATLRVVLLLAIVGQIVFLASRYRTRLDVTADDQFTLTDSTYRVLGNLQDRLRIEAYFSSADDLPQVMRDWRRALDNFLDELVEIGDGKVVVQRFDPQSDNAVRERANRLGINGETVSDRGETQFAFKEIWQGLRLLYAGDRQHVIRFVPMHYQSPSPAALWEAQLTPQIKALTVENKPMVGLLAFPTEAGGGNPQFGGGSRPQGFARLPETVKGHYTVENVNLSEGQLVPDKYETLVVVRPKRLTDRQKYALDQFLMRGGSLIVFADTHEVEIGEQRTFRGRKVSYDVGGSELKFLDQLAHYGVRVQEKVINEALQDARGPGENFTIMQQTIMGPQPTPLRPYPYWFHALAFDYGNPEFAKRIAEISAASNGDGVDELAAKFEQTFEPGMNLDNFVMKALGESSNDRRGPGMFWACPVDLVDELPAGVEGEVLMRTSPVAWLEDPPPDFNPIGMSPQPAQREVAFERFRQKFQTAFGSEPRQQFGLMVHLTGTFPSFFDGKDIPPEKEPDPNEAKPDETDPLAEPVTDIGRQMRNYPEQPPVIPHDISGYQLTLQTNTCMTCHKRQYVERSGAPMISITHFQDRDGQMLADVAPRRYFCTQCHVQQTDAQPLVENLFVDMLELRGSAN